jgi:hypothetical protein
MHLAKRRETSAYRANKELSFRGEVWRRSYSDHRIMNGQSFQQHREYIEDDPVKAGSANTPDWKLSHKPVLKVQPF